MWISQRSRRYFPDLRLCSRISSNLWSKQQHCVRVDVLVYVCLCVSCAFSQHLYLLITDYWIYLNKKIYSIKLTMQTHCLASRARHPYNMVNMHTIHSSNLFCLILAFSYPLSMFNSNRNHRHHRQFQFWIYSLFI